MNAIDVNLPDAIPLERLLAPLPIDGGVGPSLQYDPLLTRIQDARLDEDDTLPMGVWERPVRRADWTLVARLCEQALAERGKDLRVAGWLVEAWVRLHGLPGLWVGFRLLRGLSERFWEGLWPAWSEEEPEARAAPYVWVERSLPGRCELHMTLVEPPEGEPITLAKWRALEVREVPPQDDESEASGAPAELTVRERWLRTLRQPGLRETLDARRTMLIDVLDECRALEGWLRERMGDEAPPLRSMAGMLERMVRIVEHWLDGGARASLPAASGPDLPRTGAVSAANGGEAPGDRAAAYRQLAEIERFLARSEPHSPVPYLLRRAIDWGGMSLGDLLLDLERQDEDGVARLVTVARARGE